MPELLNIPEAAKRLKVSATTIRRLVLAGKIKSFRVGDLIRIREVDLVEFVEQQLQGKTA